MISGSGENTTKSRATRGGKSSRIGQEPQGTGIDSRDENKETGNNICEGPTQAVEATSALDMIVGAVIIRDYPKCSLTDAKIKNK